MPQDLTANGRTPERLVFVYGTLREGEVNDIRRLRPMPRRLGTGRTRGRLWDLGWYPGAQFDAAGADDWVHGEVYAIAAALERALDTVEEILPAPNGEYRKRWIDVEIGARALRCIAYECSPIVAQGRAPIPGGDWVAWRRARR